jgi:hypothetical protein
VFIKLKKPQKREEKPNKKEYKKLKTKSYKLEKKWVLSSKTFTQQWRGIWVSGRCM